MGLFTVRSMASFAFSPMGRMMTAGFREPTNCTTNPETPSCSCSGIDDLNSARRRGGGRAEVVKRCSTRVRASKLIFKLLTILSLDWPVGTGQKRLGHYYGNCVRYVRCHGWQIPF